MDLVSIVLPMGIGMKEPGMRVEDRGLECTHSEMGKPNLVTGKMEFSIFQAHRIRLILYHLLQFTTPKYSMQCMYLNLFNQTFIHFNTQQLLMPKIYYRFNVSLQMFQCSFCNMINARPHFQHFTDVSKMNEI